MLKPTKGRVGHAAVERLAHAIRLSPQNPHIFSMISGIATAHFFAGRYGEALVWAKTPLRSKPDIMTSSCVVAASVALSGQAAEADVSMAVLRRLDPDMRISNLEDRFPISRLQDFARWVDGLRKAGLPE